MKRSVFTFLLGVGAVSGCAESDNNASGAVPFRDAWRTVVDQPFLTFDAEGAPNVNELSIGGTSTNENFANRGDVIVRYADVDRITVEMRRFTMADNLALAEQDFERLQIWAYSSGGSPKPPPDMDAEDACIDPFGAAPWPNDCRILVYYDGLSQVARSGADFRVTLPNDYIFEVDITTEDNAIDSDYQNRGDVCIENLPGSARVSLGSGAAYVVLAPDISEMPECPADAVAECQASGWDNDTCPCFAGANSSLSFGQVRVESLDAASADATVDIPSTGSFWATYNMRNEGDNRVDGGDSPGALCEATVDPGVGTVEVDPTVNLNQEPWRNQGAINFPGGNATEGAGFSIQLTSEQCADVKGTDAPEDFAGKNAGSEQGSTERGNLTICAGCLREANCDALVPGT